MSKYIKFAIIPIILVLAVVLSIKLINKSGNDTPNEESKNETKNISIDFHTVTNLALSPDGDNDEDTIINSKEEELGTNPLNGDTDGDLLSDNHEIELGTDPLNPDTDDDKITDGCEIEAKTDPLTPDEYKEDLNIKVEPTFTNKGKSNNKYPKPTLKLNNSDANGYASELNSINNIEIGSNPTIISDIYKVHLKSTSDNTSAQIEFNTKNISDDADKASLKIYSYNYEKHEYTEEKSEILGNGNISCNVLNDTFYVLASGKISTDLNTHISFVIDDSGSMYDEGNAGKPGNDPNYLRYNMVSDIINNLGVDKYTYSIYTFSSETKQFADNINNIGELTNAIKEAKENKRPWDGTRIITAMNTVVYDMSKDKNVRKIIVLLSDGKDTGLTTGASDYDMAGYNAHNNGIATITICLGNEVDENFSKIAQMSSGFNYYAQNSNSLNEIVLKIRGIFEDLGGWEQDKVIADCGFNPTINGFSFNNYGTEQEGGQCFGMATFARNYYMKELMIASDSSENQHLLKGKDALPYSLEDTELWEMYMTDKPLSSWTTEIEKDDNGVRNLGLIRNSENAYNKLVEELPEDILDDWKVHETIAAMFNWQFTDAAKKHTLHTQDNFNELVTMVSNGEPVVLGVSGKHAVNVCQIKQSWKDPDIYYFGFYENNINDHMTWAEFKITGRKKERKNFDNWDMQYEFYYDAINGIPDNEDMREESSRPKDGIYIGEVEFYTFR